MTELNILPVLILIGRPASGKSEIIDYLQKMGDVERRDKFNLGELEVIDDFPMLWTWFEEDTILSKRLDQPRLHTDEQGYFKYSYQWDLLIERLDLEYYKRLRDEIGLAPIPDNCNRVLARQPAWWLPAGPVPFFK